MLLKCEIDEIAKRMRNHWDFDFDTKILTILSNLILILETLDKVFFKKTFEFICFNIIKNNSSFFKSQNLNKVFTSNKTFVKLFIAMIRFQTNIHNSYIMIFFKYFFYFFYQNFKSQNFDYHLTKHFQNHNVYNSINFCDIVNTFRLENS